MRGSSPLARGLRLHRRRGYTPPRIIPARAGFTPARPGPAPPASDHPRSRGVYAPPGVKARSSAGSSPLARGLRDDLGGCWGSHRIIPARAGFTSSTPRTGTESQDHPRSRGVYAPTCCGPVSRPGSSPLARGLPSHAHPVGASSRIIPARAGFTRHPRDLGPGRRDHPRSRGVYLSCSSSPRCGAGSSPLARGLPVRWTGARSCFRIIPARAGFTTCGLEG